jgi:L,D-transpeptidase ErfK/SrfK
LHNPWLRLCLFLSLTFVAVRAAAQALVGGVFEHTVRRGESLTQIGTRHGVDPRVLARENGLDWNALIHPGQRLKVDNRHIVPEPVLEGIVINLPQRMLFLFRGGRLVAHYPVGLGRPDWPTPVGRYRIREKVVDKTWIVPPSIQAEMAAKGLPVRERVPPGPDNPLGRHWLGLSPGAWGIHATIAPASIYHFQSHGCIRLHPDDAADLFGRVAVGEAVALIYQPLLLARAEEGPCTWRSIATFTIGA